MNQNQTQTADHRKTLLSWEAPEYIRHHRGRNWYIVAGLVLAGLLTYAFFTGSLTMALAFILLAAVFLLAERKQPRRLITRVTDLGIEHGGEFYPFHHINAFWLVYYPPLVTAMYLRVIKGRHIKHLRIELGDQMPQEVRELLLKELPEIEGAREPFSDLLARLLKLH